MISQQPRITPHAWRRWISRYRQYVGRFERCPYRTLLDLMASAEPEDLGAGVVLRMLANGLEPARYFATPDGWRFVLHETDDVLLTVERVFARKRDKPKGKRPWWRG
jgi:hypothetical protein